MLDDTVERALATSYAAIDARPALGALFALDDTLAQILRTTRDPLVGQMRLTWWHGALGALDTAPPPAQPVLQALAAEVLPRGVSGTQLAGMIDGWEALLDFETLGETGMVEHARLRGAAFFEAAGVVLRVAPGDPLAAAGTVWALADLSRHLRDGDAAARAAVSAKAGLSAATSARWSRAGRPLGALVQIARMDLMVPLDRPVPRGAPWRVARLAWHRISGR